MSYHRIVFAVCTTILVFSVADFVIARILVVGFLAAWWATPRCVAENLPGLSTLTSAHLTLVTDVPLDAELKALPDCFEQAVRQWCDYFDVPPERLEGWHVQGFLMQSRERFQAAGLIPSEVPEFTTGYALGNSFWLFEQTSVYYRRHLFLHEGVHCFMRAILGDVGPAWYAEGMAELLATHQFADGKITLGIIPGDRDTVAKWGRIEAVQDAYLRRKALTPERLFKLSGTLHGTVEKYGWCWAGAAFFEHHPRYHDRFRKLPTVVTQPDFDQHVEQLFAPDRAQLDEDWQVYIAHLDYGYDFERMNFLPALGKPLEGEVAVFEVAADRGWQSSGIALEPGKKYHITAQGRYQVVDGETPWQSEPGGVTIRYHRGEPLGKLLAAIRDNESRPNHASGLTRPIPIGLDAVLEAPRGGTLYFRINDSAGELADNQGHAVVEIRQVD